VQHNEGAATVSVRRRGACLGLHHPPHRLLVEALGDASQQHRERQHVRRRRSHQWVRRRRCSGDSGVGGVTVTVAVAVTAVVRRHQRRDVGVAAVAGRAARHTIRHDVDADVALRRIASRRRVDVTRNGRHRVRKTLKCSRSTARE
jgi:hypothetical protein